MKEAQLNNGDTKVQKGFTLGIRYVLPSGNVRYHCDSFCSTSTDIEDAKPYFSKQNTLEKAFAEAEEWLNTVKINFKYTFTGEDEDGKGSTFFSATKDHPFWEGVAFEDIKIELFHQSGRMESDYRTRAVSIDVIDGEVVTTPL